MVFYFYCCSWNIGQFKLISTEKKLIHLCFCDYLANSQRLGHEIKVAEDTLRKELRGTIIRF